MSCTIDFLSVADVYCELIVTEILLMLALLLGIYGLSFIFILR